MMNRVVELGDRLSRRITLSLIFLVAIAIVTPSVASEADDLRAKLDDFLANVTNSDTHDRFWAEDLIYTSSSGARTTKSDIMAGFGVADSAGDDGAPGPAFSAEEVQIQVYGDTAVVAFKLVATPPVGSEVLGMQNYFNTGTFVKRNGEWRAVAWQATIIPEGV